MKHAVITGTNRGLGLEFVRQYLQRGWRVTAINRSASEELSALAQNETVRIINANLSDGKDMDRIAHSLSDETIDLLINNAGIMGTDTFRLENTQRQGLHDFSRDEWRSVFEINVFSPAELIATLKNRFSSNARIITISSEMGSISGNSFGGWYAYRASKAAVNALMKSVSLELADQGIVAAALHPGWVRTDMGGPDAAIDVQTSISGMIQVIDNLTATQSGGYFAYDGDSLDY